MGPRPPPSISTYSKKSNANTVPSSSKMSETSTTVKTTNESIPAVRKIGPGDIGFRVHVLDPRGIEFCEPELQDPFEHFETTPPEGSYKDLNLDTTVWLDLTEDMIEEIEKEYAFMKSDEMLEIEYQIYALEVLLRRERNRREPNDKTTSSKVDRMIGVILKPGVASTLYWDSPDIIKRPPEGVRFYNWDIRPDLTYWLSMVNFPQSYRNDVKEHMMVLGDYRFSPYFTSGFKREPLDEPVKAQDQIAVAATLALYNRCKLKVKRLMSTGHKWTVDHTLSLKHYALTLEGDKFTFWSIKLPQKNHEPISPHLWQWPGCEIRCVCRGELRLGNSRKFAMWLNEIHRWGLTEHFRDVKRDVQFIMDAKKKTPRTSLDLNNDSDYELDDFKVKSNVILGGLKKRT